MATNNAVNVGLSGSTGTVNFVGSTSPTLVTPILGAASATSLTFSSTSGIIGTTTNNDAAALSVGEYVTSNIAFASRTSINDSTATSLTSISLTAGDWNVWGSIYVIPTVGCTALQTGISTTNNTMPDNSLTGSLAAATAIYVNGTGVIAPQVRLSLNATTTVYIVGYAAFAAGTCEQCGFISARRIR